MDPHEHSNEQSVDRSLVPLTSDFVFKYVFGAAQSTEILRSLLSAVDVKARDITGAAYTMEAQATWHAAFASRALYWWARRARWTIRS
ncbi:MAG: hypothetical protein WD492_01345 [Alkalispirochaeta sp.]